MLREDPTAFREMVFAGLKALEELNVAPPFKAASSATANQDAGLKPGATSGSSSHGHAGDGLKSASTQASLVQNAADEAHVAAYGEFEKAANAELEKSVGRAIERALRQALPNASRGDGDALTARLSAGVRQEIEKALQGDRQLGEQVAQVLAARRFDETARAQVVRLINERAQQLVPGATKRVLHDWTQTTLAAHRLSAVPQAGSKTEKQEAASARAYLVPVQQGREVPPLRPDKNSRASGPFDSAQGRRNDNASTRVGRIDYKKLSDEQILDL